MATNSESEYWPPPEDCDVSRRVYCEPRYNMLEGRWRDEGDRFARACVGENRWAQWGRTDISQCLISDIVSGYSVQYSTTPAITNAAGGDVATRLASRLNDCGRWEVGKYAQRYIEAQRNGLLRFDYAHGDLVVTFVPANAYHCITHPYTNKLLAVFIFDGDECESWDLRDKDRPKYQIWNHTSEKPPRSFEYKWIDPETKAPYIPCCHYSAELGSGRTFDPTRGEGLVHATLMCALMNTYAQHILRNAAFPLRYLIDAIVAGTKLVNNGKNTIFDNDPAAIINLISRSERAQAGQFQDAGDPAAVTEFMNGYIARTVSSFGFKLDTERVSADPRSGYAIALSRADVREKQNSVQSAYAPPDIQSLRVCSLLLNTFAGEKLPTQGWGINYVRLALTDAEEKNRVENLRSQLDDGLLSLVDYYMQVKYVDRPTAIKALEQVQADKELFKPAAAPAPAVPPVVPANAPADPPPGGP